jgi:UPF0716 protein FxsA
VRRCSLEGRRYAASVFLILFFVFVVVPLVELAVIVTVAGAIGIFPTIALLILVSAIGAFLVKREGIGVMRRTQAAIQRGEVPGREMLDAALLMGAGALCVVPGFVTDAFGLLLLVPPVRRFIASRLIRRWTNGTSFVGATQQEIVDVEWVGDVTPRGSSSPSPIELGPVDD